jgi:hypothetical protein
MARANFQIDRQDRRAVLQMVAVTRSLRARRTGMAVISTLGMHVTFVRPDVTLRRRRATLFAVRLYLRLPCRDSRFHA